MIIRIRGRLVQNTDGLSIQGHPFTLEAQKADPRCLLLSGTIIGLDE